MYLTSSIVRQVVVSSVLFTVLQCSTAVRFTRSMRYPAPSMRKYMHPLRYLPFSAMPRSMQRRFMWKDVDDTVDGFMGGARTMTHMFSPSMVRYRKPIEYDGQSSSKMKYVIKKPPPPFKRIKVIKLRAPKKTIPVYTVPLLETPSVPPTFPPTKSNLIMPYMSEDELRKIEKEQEKRVENESDSGVHEHTHQTLIDDDVVSGKINEFGEGWLPIKTPYATPKPFAVSQLHTKVEIPTTFIPFIPSQQKDTHPYEVNEHTAEASVQKEQTFKPSNHFSFLGPTTEVPNYPDFFLKTIQTTEESFKPTRVQLGLGTTFATAASIVSATTLSHRLPPRSTTERPFKRYNLHRPKSSKLFFSRPTSSLESTKQAQTTSTTERSISVVSEAQPFTPEPIMTTRESIKTTRAPLRTTRAPTKAPTKPPPEKVRTTRNDSEVRAKIRIKNSSQNETSNKTLNMHRGTVKFGEKQS